MREEFARTELLFGDSAMERLAAARVAVFGIGGVGCAVAEALARGGIGALDLVDDDVFTITNLNRQLFALRPTLGRSKADVAKERIALINPSASVVAHKIFYGEANKGEFDFSLFDYVVDAIDTVSGKIALVMQAKECDTPVISCMGTGNKLDPSRFEVADIYDTSVCPLARVMRRELKRREVDSLKVVYSREEPLIPSSAEKAKFPDERTPGKKDIPGSTSFVPAVAGFILAGEVIRDVAFGGKPLRSQTKNRVVLR